MDLLFATHNHNKVKEALDILKGFNVIGLDDLKDESDVEETGQTFYENAYLKAKYYFDKYHRPTFADDSGLVVPSLNGEPGIYSARYAEHGNYLKNNLLLLENMKHIKDRQAYFITVICFIDKDENVYNFEGRLNGKIDYELKGNLGFGYDPLFIIPSLGKTLGEIPKEAKNSLSHRFLALKQLIAHLQKDVK